MQKDLPTFPITINLRLVALSALILAGCQLANSTPSAPPISVTATVAPSRIPPATATTAPSLTPPATATPLPSPSPTATPQSSTCPRRVESSTVAERPTGYLILSAGDEKFVSRLYRLNLQSGARDPFLPDLPPGFVAATITSPDGRWLAFVYTEESVDRRQEIGESLVVASADATEVHVIPLVEQLQYIQLANWTSDSQRIVAYPFFDQNTLPGRRPDKIVLIDPFTEKWEFIQPSFSYNSDELWEYWGSLGGSVAYDPTMTRVVYLDDASTWVLYDLEHSRELWRAYLFGVLNPVWDKAGNLFVFPDEVEGDGGARAAEFVTVSRDGEVVHTGPIARVETGVSFYGLSPDRRYIWFELPDGPLGPGDYFWDRESNTSIDCFKDDSILFPVWSPDGRYFLHHSTTLTGEPAPLLAIDLQANIYFELGPAEEFPDAWLSAAK